MISTVNYEEHPNMGSKINIHVHVQETIHRVHVWTNVTIQSPFSNLGFYPAKSSESRGFRGLRPLGFKQGFAVDTLGYTI